MDQITFEQDYPFKPFVLLALYRYFTRPVWIMMYAIWLFFLVMSLTYTKEVIPDVTIFFFCAFLLVLPLMIVLGTRNLFRSHYMFSDELSFTITDKEIKVSGTHFDSRMDWEVISHVQEYKNWMMIFVSRQHAYYIYKPQVDPMDWQILKSIVGGREDITAKLRK